jgi:hypothetical protein
VSADGRFVVLLGVLLTSAAVIMGGVLFCLRTLWNIRGAWDTTNGELARLADRFTAGQQGVERLERALDRHLEWHDRH